MNKNDCLRWFSLIFLPSVLLACAPIVDGDEVGRRIQREFERKTKIAVDSVDCPQDIESKVGNQFKCKIYAPDRKVPDGKILEVQVTLKDDQGDISWSVQTGLVNLGVIEENIEKTFETERLSKVKASCDGKFKIVHKGDTFECNVQEGNDNQGKVMVQVTDPQGKVNFQFLDNPDPALQEEQPSTP